VNEHAVPMPNKSSLEALNIRGNISLTSFIFQA
jgi:hypothetical protein